MLEGWTVRTITRNVLTGQRHSGAAGITRSMLTELERLERLADVKARIAAAEAAAGRAPGSVTLIAVSKTVPVEVLVPFIEAGQRAFGENRVQEAEAKWPALKKRFPDIRLHLIGALQSNKAREAVALFDAIHTVDREKIAGALAAAMAKQGRRPELLVQVNTGAEPQKAGVLPGEVEALVTTCRTRFEISISGLMCIPPLEDIPAPHFALLAKLAARADLRTLSMGMSADFESAIAFGATYVRVGTALFGERTKI
jgi:pyridoxal phosphate enzyme (YggS family)